MKILEKLEAFKKHTYTPNEFYGDLGKFITQITSQDFLVKFGMVAMTGVVLANINAGMTQDIVLRLGDSDGIEHDWFNGDLAVAFVTSADGVAGDADGAPIIKATFVKGVAQFTVYYSGTFANAETVTLTVGTSDVVMGKTLTAKAGVILTVEAGE